MGNEHSQHKTQTNNFDSLRATPYDPYKPPLTIGKPQSAVPQPKRRVGEQVSLKMRNDDMIYLSTIIKVGRREGGTIAYLISPDGFNGTKDEWVDEDDARIGKPNWSTTHNEARVVRDTKRRPPGCKCLAEFECVCVLVVPRQQAHATGGVYVNPDVPNRPNDLINPNLAQIEKARKERDAKRRPADCKCGPDFECTCALLSVKEPEAKEAKESKTKEQMLDELLAFAPTTKAVPVQTATPANTPAQPSAVPMSDKPPSTLLSVESVMADS